MAVRRRAFAALLAAGVVAAGLGVVALASGPLATFLDDSEKARAQEVDASEVTHIDLDSVFTDLTGVGGGTYFNYRFGRGIIGDPLDPAAGRGETSAGQDETVTESCETRARAVEETRIRPVDADFVVKDLPTPVVEGGETGPPPLLSGTARVGAVYAGTLDPELFAQPDFAPAWFDCVARHAEEGTEAVLMTVAGVDVMALTALETAPPGTPQIDAIAWIEAGLEVWVFGARIIEGGGSDRLQERTNGVEPVVEVAEAIMSRNFDETRVLLDDAFSPPPGVRYGVPEPGVEDRVRAAFRQSVGAEKLQNLVQDAADEFAADIETNRELPEVLEENDGALLIQRAEERLVDSGAGGDARVQVVVWEPAFLNTGAFRRAWRQGIELSVTAPDDVRFSERDEVREYAVTTSEGRTEVHWISDCYTVKVAATDETSALTLGDRVMLAQASAAQETFGVAPAGDDTRKGDRRRDRQNVARCARPRLAELRSSVQFISPDQGSQRKLERARDAAIDVHEADGAFPADPDLLEIEQPAIDFRGGVAETTSEVEPVFVLVGNGGKSICLSARSPSDTLFMVKVTADDGDSDGYAVSYAEGPEIPRRCGPDRLSPGWTPLEDPTAP